MTREQQEEIEAIAAALAAPFESHEVKWKPGVVNGNRALAIPFMGEEV